MKNKIKILAIALLILIIFTIIITTTVIAIYFFQGNITSKVPEYMSKMCVVQEEEFQGRNVFVIEPKDKKENTKVIFYLHGGSYMAELSEVHWNFLRHLAQDTGYTLIVPDYPLAPQYQYEDVFSMIIPLYREVIKKVEPKNIIAMGDSAGGGMTLALMENISMSDEKILQPGKIILISPWLDVTMQNEEISKVEEKDKILNKELLKLAGISYAGSEEKTKEYLVSPIYGKIEGLNNIIIYTGTFDILNPDVHKFEEKAKEEKVNIKIKETEEAEHNWLLKQCDIEEQNNSQNENAYQDLIEEIKK